MTCPRHHRVYVSRRGADTSLARVSTLPRGSIRFSNPVAQTADHHRDQSTALPVSYWLFVKVGKRSCKAASASWSPCAEAAARY